MGGGSVPSLVEFILAQNEIEKKYEIDVYSCFNEDAVKAAQTYKYSKFIYAKDAKWTRFITNLKFSLKNRLHLPFDLSAISLPTSARKKFESQKYDVVYISGYVRGALPIIRIAQTNNSKILVHHHTVTNYHEDATIRGTEIIDNSDAVLFVSEFAANYTRVGTSKQNDKIRVFKNAIDVNKFKFEDRDEVRKSIREKYNINANDIVILFVGRMVDYKGAFELIRAFNLFKDKDNLKLLVVGGATYSSTKVSPYVQKCLDEARCNPNIIFTGYVNYYDIPKYYVAADISTLLSKCLEACGLVGIESMAAGLPIITTNRGGIGEYVSEDSCVVVPLNNMVDGITDAISRLIQDENMRRSMSLAGIERATHFDKVDYFSRFVKIIETL